MSAVRGRLSLIVGALTITAALAVGVVTWARQGQSPLQITSPSDSEVVTPGQTISVSVTSPANASFSQVGVIGEDPIGFGSTSTSVPAALSVSIPASIACRKFMLTAVGATSSGQFVQSPTILIDVERADMPTAISPQIPSLTFKALGEQFPLKLLGTFSNGHEHEIGAGGGGGVARDRSLRANR